MERTASTASESAAEGFVFLKKIFAPAWLRSLTEKRSFGVGKLGLGCGRLNSSFLKATLEVFLSLSNTVGWDSLIDCTAILLFCECARANGDRGGCGLIGFIEARRHFERCWQCFGSHSKSSCHCVIY